MVRLNDFAIPQAARCIQEPSPKRLPSLDVPASAAKSQKAKKPKRKNKKEQRTDIEDDELNFLSKRGSKMLLISAVSTCMESLLGKKILDSWRVVFKDNKNFDKLVEEWKAILDVLMPWHSTLEPAIGSGLKSKEATQNAAKQLRATLTSFSSMYAQQLKPFSDSINTDM